MKIARIIVVAIMCVMALGCNPGPKTEEVTPMANPAKRALEGIAQSGEMTSGMVEVEGELANLKQTDPAKGEKLMKEYDELKVMSDPAQIKAKAKAMADQL